MELWRKGPKLYASSMSVGTAACPCVVALYGYQNAPTEALTELYYCEECCSLRCNDCIAWEVSCTYCPHCLFEVPNTSVRAQKARCSRTCFECPMCMHVLSIVGSDPPRRDMPLTAPEASIGVEPFYLSCACCRWDSKRLGLVAEKPNDLGSVLDAMERSAWPTETWEHLVEHMLERRPPPPPLMSRSLAKHIARVERSSGLVRHDMARVSTLAQRWTMQPCEQSYAVSALRPRRVALLCKYSKRCATCRHILVRPEPRSSAFKIKLLASHFLPQCVVFRGAHGLWTLVLTNPLMDAMDVTLRCVAGDVSAQHIQVPAHVDVLDMDEDSDAPGSDWDAFQHGTKTHRNHAYLSVRVHPSTSVLVLQIQWQSAAYRPHSFWTHIPLS